MSGEPFTPKEAADKLGMGVKRLNQLCREGKIRFISIGGTKRITRRFMQKHLDLYLADNTVKRAAAVAAASTKKTVKSKAAEPVEAEPETSGFWEDI